MIDLHTHILSGIDDGARTLDDALEMARAFVADGITAVAATPHVRDDYPTSADVMLQAVDELRGALDEAGIPLTLLPGAELAVDRVARLDKHELGRLTLAGGGQYVLVETPYYELKPSSSDGSDGGPLEIVPRAFPAGILSLEAARRTPEGGSLSWATTTAHSSSHVRPRSDSPQREPRGSRLAPALPVQRRPPRMRSRRPRAHSCGRYPLPLEPGQRSRSPVPSALAGTGRCRRPCHAPACHSEP